MQIRALVEKLDAPKKKSIWDVLPQITTFLATVVLAAISLFFSVAFQRTQVETQRLQLRVEELKAITALAPILASSDPATRKVGIDLMIAVQRSGGGASSPLGIAQAPSAQPSASVLQPGASTQPAPPRPQAPPLVVVPVVSKSVLEEFAAIALSATETNTARVNATKSLGAIAASRDATAELREQAVDTVVRVAGLPDVPEEVKSAAEAVLERIKRVTVADAVADIQKAKVDRPVREVILHHAGIPSKGAGTARGVLNIAKHQVKTLSWNKVSWHYAIAADGSVWLGTPLGSDAVHAQKHNKSSVSVLLLLNGNDEEPTEQQQQVLRKILRGLFARFRIDPEDETPGKGFHLHSDLDGVRNNCPGDNITREWALEGI